jgi:cysteine sulfinate desulfinase/cysteine desulfurase-like protein
LLQAKDVDGAVELSGRALMLRDEMGGVEEDEADVFAAHVAALEAQGKKVEARAVRKRGREQVEEIARRIQDDRWRARFLMGVPAHEALGVDQDITALGTRERTDR